MHNRLLSSAWKDPDHFGSSSTQAVNNLALQGVVCIIPFNLFLFPTYSISRSETNRLKSLSLFPAFMNQSSCVNSQKNPRALSIPVLKYNLPSRSHFLWPLLLPRLGSANWKKNPPEQKVIRFIFWICNKPPPDLLFLLLPLLPLFPFFGGFSSRRGNLALRVPPLASPQASSVDRLLAFPDFALAAKRRPSLLGVTNSLKNTNNTNNTISYFDPKANFHSFPWEQWYPRIVLPPLCSFKNLCNRG